ncbi:MAG: tripartite tricarboxylate transporter TctB family protein [Pseudomonadota bacterium]
MAEGSAPGRGPAALTRDRIAGSVLLLLALGIAWQTRDLPLGSLTEPGPAYMPLLVAILLGALGVAVALTGGRSPSLGSMRWPESGHAAMILLACAFAAVALERLGYRLTTIALLVFLVGVVERKPPAIVAALALGLSMGSFFLFSDLLRVPLPRGPWNF